MSNNTPLRNICFTINNYTPDEEQALQAYDCQYLVYGREVGERCGTPHLQCYLEFGRQVRFNTFKKVFPRAANIKSRKGTPLQASNYCKKGSQSHDEWSKFREKGPNFGKDASYFESGEMGQQGKRNDLDAFVEEVSAKRPRTEDLLTSTLYMRYPRHCQQVIDHYHPPQDLDSLDNLWIWGPSGSGKSRKARADYPNHFVKPLNKWFDGYFDQDTVIIDEWSPDTAYLTQHLKIWADHYPFQAEIKGQTRLIRPRRIVVTSNYSPEECFSRSSDLDPILRRFNVVRME